MATDEQALRPLALTAAVDQLLRPTLRLERLHSDRHGRPTQRILVATDAAMLAAAFAASGLVGDYTHSAAGAVGLSIGLLAFWLVLAQLRGLYGADARHPQPLIFAGLPKIAGTVGLLAWAAFAYGWLFTDDRVAFPAVARFGLFVFALVAGGRAIVRSVAARRRSHVERTVIVGMGTVGQWIARSFLRHADAGFEVIGFVDDGDPGELAPDLARLGVLGPLSRLRELVRQHDVERVVIAFTEESDGEILGLVDRLRELDVRVDIVPRLFEVVGANAVLHSVAGMALVGLPSSSVSRWATILKRAMDLTLGGALLILLAPVFLVVGLFIKFDSRGPVFFRQTRIGARNTPFRMVKFRTMSVGADACKAEFAALNRHARPGGDARMFKIVEDPRTTRVGRFLRAHFLDELPQLLNVLKGEMTLVGPRPLIPEEDQFIEGRARRRLDLKPGMTGLWQVLGRSAIPFEEMSRLDYLYVSNWSLRNDWRLLASTVPIVLRGAGRYA